MATTKYNVGEKVYALNCVPYDGVVVPTSINICTILSIYISEAGIEYNVRDYYEDTEWAFSVNESDISKNLQKLAQKLEF